MPSDRADILIWILTGNLYERRLSERLFVSHILGHKYPPHCPCNSFITSWLSTGPEQMKMQTWQEVWRMQHTEIPRLSCATSQSQWPMHVCSDLQILRAKQWLLDWTNLSHLWRLLGKSLSSLYLVYSTWLSMFWVTPKRPWEVPKLSNMSGADGNWSKTHEPLAGWLSKLFIVL